MKKYILFFAVATISTAFISTNKIKAKKGWISLFDGKTLDGWKANKPGTFSVEDGSIKVAGATSHLFYEGPVMNHDFKNFEFKARVMTKPGSNSGIYFHTVYQESGFPDNGFEVQVNNSYTDWIRTGSLYNVKNTGKVYVKDNVWFTEYIKVEGKHVIVKINNDLVTDWTQPDDYVAPKDQPGRIISDGTFALQGHDPKSVIYYKDIMVKPLP
ncbi:MAG: 3-keto-disaccharide hydrolase [Ginsengibacter sp.]